MPLLERIVSLGRTAQLRRIACGVLAALALASCATPDASRQVIPPARKRPGATSWKAQREENVVMQRRDFTCGAAALATLLKYYFGEEKAGEQEILADIFGRMTEDEVARRQGIGLSMLDLRDCARRRGYTADGLKLDIADLEQLNGAVLVHTIRDGLAHFSILRAVRGDKTYLSDPSYGNLTIQTTAFAREWTGFVLCIDKPGFTAAPDNPLNIDNDPSTSAMPSRYGKKSPP